MMESKLKNRKIELEPEATVFWFAFVCKGTLKAYEKIKQVILKTGEVQLRYQTKSPVQLWISKKREGGNGHD
jgi:hypothetical protein